MRLGAQFFSIRNHTTTPEGVIDAFREMKRIGYQTVQLSAICTMDAAELKKISEETALPIVTTHTPAARILNETDKTVADHNIFGCKYIGLGAMAGTYRGSMEGAQKFVADMLPAAKRIKELGSLFMYHNHAFEYEKVADGRTVMEVLSDEFAPGEMGFTLDTYWVKAGDHDPVSEIKRLSGRIPCVHFKDMEVLGDGTKRFTWVGNGILDFEAIAAALENTGTDYAFIEQDNCFGADPFECLKNSYNYLKSIGLN